MSIKSQTIQQIEEVLKQNKKYYRIYDFPFPTNRNGYSTHQGAVLRNYLRAKGYVNVRVSEISQKFFTDNQASISASLRGKTVTQIMLKPSNTIIIKIEDYLQYKKNMFTAENFNKNVKTFEKILQPTKLSDKPTIALLIDKYSERLKNLKAYDSESGESLSDTERHDLEQRIRDHAEIVRDLKSIS